MLRLLVAALLVANLLFLAWHHTPLPAWLGMPAASSGREPDRLQRQVHPEAVRLLGPGAASASAPAAPAAAGSAPGAAPLPASAGPGSAGAAALPMGSLCLEAGPLNDAQAAAAARELTQAGVAAGGWVDIRRELPGRWIVYMGRYPEREALQKKLEELQRLAVAATEVKSPAELAPGLALGEFGTQADALARLERLQARGVRTARVLQLPSPGAEHQLRADRVARAAGERLAAVNGAPNATKWQACGP